MSCRQENMYIHSSFANTRHEPSIKVNLLSQCLKQRSVGADKMISERIISSTKRLIVCHGVGCMMADKCAENKSIDILIKVTETIKDLIQQEKSQHHSLFFQCRYC